MTRARARTLMITVVAAAAVAMSCVPVPPAEPPPPDAPCGAPSRSCAVPFPSEGFMVADGSTATGFRLDLPEGSFDPAVLRRFGPAVTIEDEFTRADGFSPQTPIVFQFPVGIRVGSIPPDGGDVVKVFDQATGARVPIRVEVSEYLRDEYFRRGVLMAWPQVAFEHGHSYLAVVTDAAGAEGGGSLPPTRWVPAGRSPEVTDGIVRRMHRAAAVLDPGTDAGDYVAMTSFVVRSEQNLLGPTEAMIAEVRAADHPVRGLSVGPSLGGGAATITGQIRTLDFRRPDGVVPDDGTAVGVPRWIDFTMTMPEPDPDGSPAPVSIYGHGLSVFKETQLVVSPQNADHGVATVGIDIPNHGSRTGDGGYLLTIAEPRQLGRIVGMTLQGELDNLSLMLAIEKYFGDIDLLPYDVLGGSRPDGVPDLDPTRILYQGTSMGGVLGSAFLGMAPEVDAAFLQVPGAGIMDTIFHSVLWVVFQNTLPDVAKYGDAHVLVAAAQNMMDRGDASTWASRLRDLGTPVFLVYAVDDGIVPNESTDRLIEMLELPRVGPVLSEPTIASGNGLPSVAEMPDDLSGAQQIPTWHLHESPLQPLLTHTAFTDPVPRRALDTWLRAVTGDPS